MALFNERSAIASRRVNLMRLGLTSTAILIFAVTSWGQLQRNQSTQHRPRKEQTDFGSDSELERPIPLPSAALDALRAALKATPDELSDDDLKASEIHLAGPSESDLIVPRVAAHAAFFYILKPTRNGYELIFDSGGDSLTFLRTHSHGYRDFQTWNYSQAGRWQTSTVYRFNGQRYVRSREETIRSE